MKLFFIIILLIAGLLRFWGLATNPPSLYWDEVSQGYNAYSILKTGYDEHHQFLPITHFEAFGDDKAPVYIYLDVLAMAIFGKTNFAVRFPSAFFGTLTVLFAGGLVYELFFKHKKRDVLTLLAAGLLAISPWHIQLSRVAYEGNIATFFTILGAYLFFLAKRKNIWFFLPSVISFVLSFYAFNAQRVFVPLLVIFLFLFFWKDFLQKKKMVAVVASIIIGIILLVPFMLYLKNPVSRVRFQEVNIFSDPSVVTQSNAWRQEENNSKLSNILHNRRIMYGFLYMQHYFDFFNPQFLFGTGDVNPRFSLQDNGELFWFELPLILAGLYTLIKMRNKTTAVILVWLFLAPVAGATARETPHALRGETFIPVYDILAALGAISILAYIKKPVFQRIFIGFFGVWAFLSIILFVHDYFAHFPNFNSFQFQYGYKQAVQEAQKLQNNYDLINFSNYYGRAYIYLLFYGNIEPQQYWKDKNETRDVFGLYNVWGIGKYRFGPGFGTPGDTMKKALYIGIPKEMPIGVHVIKKINFLDGDTAFVIASNK